MPRFLHIKRGIFILRCKVFNFRSFVSRHIILVGIDNCAFKLMTCSSSDGVRNVVAYAVGIGAVGYCNEQVICLDKLDFVDCEAAVNCNGCDSFELTAVECLSEYDVRDVHVGISFLFQSLVMLMFDMSA